MLALFPNLPAHPQTLYVRSNFRGEGVCKDFTILFSWMDVPSSENVRLGFYFADLIFVVCQSTAKTAEIGSYEISGYTVCAINFYQPKSKKGNKVKCYRSGEEYNVMNACS